ncbi:MAG TPA: hypothetical protein H9669_03735 [Firmicutes bacterium]|nr:hypothetical protein [Bacillota bacterium]
MNLFQTIIFGALSGFFHLTPLSWFGHLSIIQYFWGDFNASAALLTLIDVALLLAIVIYFYKDLWRLIRHPRQRYTFIALCAALAGVVVGIFFHNISQGLMVYPWLSVAFLAVTAAVIWFTGNYHGKKRAIDLSIPESFIIGLLGMLCLLPGMSFPAIILFLVMSRGVSKQSAIKFTYIIMVPILLGMTLGNWYDTLFLTGTFTVGIPEGIAAMVAGLTGFVGIHLTKTLIEKRKYHRFAIYCAVVILLTAGALLLGM